VSASGGYQLVQSLGTGVCGAVYLAEVAGRKVAIRQFVSTAPYQSQAWRMERQNFLDAGRRAMALQHPRIVPILEVIDESEAFLAMEYMEAETLRNAQATRTFTVEETNTLLRQVAMALDYAHQHGVVHGDVKPGDVFLDRQGATVSDFGVSPRAHLDPTRPIPPALLHLYLSPEHIRNPESVGPRSDQFALGIMAYELYTGHSPYGEGVPDLAAAILGSQIVQPSRVNPKMPPEVDAPLMRALAPDPAQRFGSCMEFVASLGAAMITQPEERGGAAKSRIWPFLAAGLLVLLSVAAVGYYVFGNKPAPQPSHTAAAGSKPVPPAPPEPLKKDTKTEAVKAKATFATATTAVSSGRSPFAEVKPRPQHVPDQPPVRRQDPSPVVVPPPPPKVWPGKGCPPPNAYESNIELQVFSAGHQINKGEVFDIGNAKLGNLAYGDLTAGVASSVALKGKLTMVWTVDRLVWESDPMASDKVLSTFRNVPVAGEYEISFKSDGCQLAAFHFRITEP